MYNLKKGIKILRVISSMNPSKGGPCQGIRYAIPYFEKCGVVNDVVCMDEEYTDYNVIDNFDIFKVGAGMTSYQYQPKLVKWLERYILDYDFIIVHGIWQYHNFAVYKILKKLKKKSENVPKVVVIPHGMLDPYFQKISNRGWKVWRNDLVWFSIEKKCINNADAIFYTCEEEMKLASTTFKGYNPKKVINVGYGIELPPENNEIVKLAFYEVCPTVKNKKYFLFLSRIHPKKGVASLINIYNEMSKDFDLPDLVIAGPINSRYAVKMMNLSSKNSKIHFSGMLSDMPKWGAIYNCSAYLLPSYQENFGIAIVEAMACKKPVLVTKNINIWSEIAAGEGGWIVNLNKKNDLKNNLYEIIKESEEKLFLRGNNAFEIYKKKFDISEYVNKFIQELKCMK